MICKIDKTTAFSHTEHAQLIADVFATAFQVFNNNWFSLVYRQIALENAEKLAFYVVAQNKKH